jgi:membrane-bound lytic murein transglycosylase D
MVVMERRKNLYFPIFEEYLKKHNMPDELKYLSIVESGLNPRAISRAGAAGLWQFMPSTGKIYKLHQDSYIDERLDPYEATEAACKYLKELYNIFHDWELALASYNCGPGNVRKAIRQSGYKDNFWDVYNHLPKETRGYVPQFVAVTYAMNYMKEHNMIADSIEYPVQFDTIMVNNNVNLGTLCEQLNFCFEDLQKLNPALKKNVLPAHVNYAIRIPSDLYPYFAQNRIAILDSSSKNCEVEIVLVKTEIAKSTSPEKRKIIYTVKSGDILGKIATKHHVSVANIKSWNKISGTTIRQGQRLIIYKKGAYTPTSAPALAKAKDKKNSLSTSAKKVYYVQPGDTLWSISKKSNITIEKLKAKNNLKGNEIKVGMKLIVG